MAELTHLDDKLGEVLGLARAAQDATQRVERLCGQEEATALADRLAEMRAQAKETEDRTAEVVARRDGRKTAIEEKAAETKREAVEMMRTYLGEDADALDGFEFLIMAEAGELGHWEIVGKLNERAGDAGVASLVDFAVPLQERHVAAVRDGALTLAAAEDPDEPA